MDGWMKMPRPKQRAERGKERRSCNAMHIKAISPLFAFVFALASKETLVSLLLSSILGGILCFFGTKFGMGMGNGMGIWE